MGIELEITQKVALTGALVFFMVGLLTGVWKYAKIRQSPEGVAPEYVSICHRASLLYSFACILLERTVKVSELAVVVELAALGALIFYFGVAVFGYAVHGWLDDTDNQLRRPYRLGGRAVPSWLVHGTVTGLVVGEVGGFAVLGFGAMVALW